MAADHLQRVLVTGYGGFLGGEVVRQLVQAGYTVRGIARGEYPHFKELGVETIRGDLSDPAVCDRAVAGCQAVIHSAALAGISMIAEPFIRANVTATAQLIRASRSAGVTAFLFVSSPSVVFDGRGQAGEDESHPYPKRYLNPYSQTKAQAERLVLASDAGDFRTCAVRPHLIWGENDPHLIVRLLHQRLSNRLRIVGDMQNRIDTVHVTAAAAACVSAIERLIRNREDIRGRAFFLSDGDPIGCWQWIERLLAAGDLTLPYKRIGQQAAVRLGRALEIAYRLSGSRKEPPMTRFLAYQLSVDHYYDIDAARRSLGYRPIDSREQYVVSMTPWIQSLTNATRLASPKPVRHR